jgi:ribosomal protein S27AE
MEAPSARLLNGNMPSPVVQQTGAPVARQAEWTTMAQGNDENRTCPRCSTGKTANVAVWLGPVVYMECDTCGFTMMAKHPQPQAAGDLANALQVALCVSAALESRDIIRGSDLRTLDDALHRAVTALEKLRGRSETD